MHANHSILQPILQDLDFQWSLRDIMICNTDNIGDYMQLSKVLELILFFSLEIKMGDMKNKVVELFTVIEKKST